MIRASSGKVDREQETTANTARADLAAELDLAVAALEGAILLVNVAEDEPSQRSRALLAVAATLQQVVDRLRERARELDET